jgi:hypothetical protein
MLTVKATVFYLLISNLLLSEQVAQSPADPCSALAAHSTDQSAAGWWGDSHHTPRKGHQRRLKRVTFRRQAMGGS